MKSPRTWNYTNRSNNVLRSFGRLFIAILAVTTLGLSIQAKSDNKFGINVDNSGQISKDYYRGGQPSRNDFVKLKQLGVKTIIDLQDDGTPEETGWVSETGMQYFNIRLSSTRKATDEQ